MIETTNSKQVKDDPELLELMMQDLKSASSLYQPTNWWSVYEKKFLPELRSLGLRNFRRRKNSILTSFAATDLIPTNIRKIKARGKTNKTRIPKFILRQLLRSKKIESYVEQLSKRYSFVSNENINYLCYEFAKTFGENCKAKSIKNFEGSDIGNPENIFSRDGKKYTTSLLSFYLNYAYCCKFMNFDSINSIMELGSGAGKQIELIKKLHPELSFYVVDIPPQLYVCEQYLSALFPESVISYRQTRSMKNIPEKRKGKIFIFGNWKIPEVTNLVYDLFWNAASFQEMEPEVVLNYLNYINRQTTKYVFLQENMKGMPITSEEGKLGVLKQTTLQHYKMGLENFHMQDLSKAIHLHTFSSGYENAFWKRK